MEMDDRESMRTPVPYAFDKETETKIDSSQESIRNRALYHPSTHSATDFLMKLMDTLNSSLEESTTSANNKKEQSFNFTYELTSEERRKIFPPSPNSVIMEWRLALLQTNHSPTSKNSQDKRTIALFPDTSNPCDSLSEYRERDEAPLLRPTLETRSQCSSLNHPDKCRNTTDQDNVLQQNSSRLHKSINDDRSTISMKKCDISAPECSNTLTNQSKTTRRRCRRMCNNTQLAISVLNESSNCEHNLASFQKIMTSKPFLEFSTNVRAQVLDSVQSPDAFSYERHKPLFPILPTSTALMILFPTIQTFSKVNRTLFGEARDRVSRTRMQEETGCRFYRLFKATLLQDCSCILCLCHDTEYGAHHAAELSIGLVASNSTDEIMSQLNETGIEIRLCNTTQFVGCISKPYIDKRTLEEDLLLGTIARSQWGRALYSFALLQDSATEGNMTSSERCRIVFQRNPLDLSSNVWMTAVEFPPLSSLPYLLEDSWVISDIEQVMIRHEFQFYMIWDEEGVRDPYVLVTSDRKEKVQRGLIEAFRILQTANERERSLEGSRTMCSTISLESWDTTYSYLQYTGE